MEYLSSRWALALRIYRLRLVPHELVRHRAGLVVRLLLAQNAERTRQAADELRGIAQPRVHVVRLLCDVVDRQVEGRLLSVENEAELQLEIALGPRQSKRVRAELGLPRFAEGLVSSGSLSS